MVNSRIKTVKQTKPKTIKPDALPRMKKTEKEKLTQQFLAKQENQEALNQYLKQNEGSAEKKKKASKRKSAQIANELIQQMTSPISYAGGDQTIYSPPAEKAEDDKDSDASNPQKKKQSVKQRDGCIEFLLKSVSKIDCSQALKGQYTKLIDFGYLNYAIEKKQALNDAFIGADTRSRFMEFIRRDTAELPDQLSFLQIHELANLCLQLLKNSQGTGADSYGLTSQLFEYVTQLYNCDELQHLDNQNVANCVRLFLSQAIIEPVTYGMLEFMLKIDLLHEYLDALQEKFAISYTEQSIMNVSFKEQPTREPSKINPSYTLFYLLQKYYPGITKTVAHKLIQSKAYFDNSCLRVLSAAREPIQIMLCHILAKHIIYDNSSMEGHLVQMQQMFQQDLKFLDYCAGSKCDNAGAITSGQLLQVFRVLQTQTQDQRAKELPGTYLNLHGKLNRLVATRTQHGMNPTEFTNYIRQMQQIYPESVDVYNSFDQVCTDLTKCKEGSFERSDYQLMVASIIMSKATNVVIKMDSGMGKTFVIIAMVRKFAERGDSVVVVLADQLLYDQFSLDQQIFLSDIENIVIKDIQFLKEQDCDGKIVIVDEFDEMIDQCPFQIFQGTDSKLKFGGMLAVSKAKQTILLSATVELCDRAFCRKLLGVQNERMIEFDGATKLFQQKTVNSVDFEVFRDETSLVNDLLWYVNQTIQKQPVIVFIEQPNQVFHDKLRNKTLALPDIGFHFVSDPDQAAKTRKACRESGKVVVLILNKFSRGYDLKLLQEAKVFIYNTQPISKAEQSQMFGRGCRSQGKPEGRMFILSKATGTKDEIYNLHLSKKDLRHVYIYDNLVKLIKFQGKVNSEALKQLQEDYKGDQWKVNGDIFEQSYPKSITILNKKTN